MSTINGGWRGPNIVKDGLVLYLDAGSPNSYYDKSSTTWKDISGGSNNGTLTNGPTFNSANGGSIVFDGSNDYILQNTSLNTGQNITVSVWIYRNSTGRGGIFTNSYPFTNSQGWYLLSYTNSSLALSVGNDNSYIISQNNSVPINAWNYVTGVIVDGKTTSLYNNGVSLTLSSNGGTSTNIIYDSGWKVGALISPLFDAFSGNIAQTQIYNRALSATEIKQNFNATRTRFGV
jgi:hypothetical protein